MNPEYFKSTDNFKDYINQSEKLTPFYRFPLYPDWAKLAGEVRGCFKQTAVIEELIAQNAKSPDNFVQKNISLLKEQNSVCVVTGQQLGLMLSPLYIIYKTISTIILCERLNKTISVYNFVPVFWLEGEDHDFEEVKSLNLFGKSGTLQNLSLTVNDEKEGFPVNSREFNDQIVEIISKLKEELQPTEFSSVLFSKLETIYKPGINLLVAFKEHMAGMFEGSGLLFFNAGSPKIKELSKPFFKQVVENNKQLVSGFKSKSAELENAGYKNQVAIQDDKAYLFLNKNGPRQALFIDDGSYFIKDTNEKFSREDLLKLLDEKPHYFSSTVLTRPLWQSWLLPTVSYVAGGAEIAYWGQLAEGFKILDLVMPQVQPRHSITLLEPKIERLLAKYEIDLLNVNADKDIFLREYFKNNQLADINSTISDFEKLVSKNSEAVKELVKQLDPTLLDPVDKSFSSILGVIAKLQGRLSNRVKEKEVTVQNHLNAIHDSLLPGGTLQERVLSSVYFDNKYGPEWVLKIKDQISENFEEHLIVKL